MEWLQNNIWEILSGLIGAGGLGAFFKERNKRKIEEKQASAEALETMQKAYDKFTEDSLKRYEGVVNEVEKQQLRIMNLEEELYKEKGKLALLKEENEKLRMDNAKLKADYDILKEKFENLKV